MRMKTPFSAVSERGFTSAGVAATCLKTRLIEFHLEAQNTLHCGKQLLQKLFHQTALWALC